MDRNFLSVTMYSFLFLPYFLSLNMTILRNFLTILFFFWISISSAIASEMPGVAILYFNYDGQTAELQVLKKGIAQMLISHIQPNTPNVKIVERERLEDILQELELSASGKIDQATAAKVGKLIGAKYIVVGSFFDLFGTLRIDSRLIEVETGKVVGAAGHADNIQDFFAIETKVVQGLTKHILDIPQEEAKSSPIKKQPTKTSTPQKPTEKASAPKPKVATATIITYSKALDAKDSGDTGKMKEHLATINKEEASLLDLDALLQ